MEFRYPYLMEVYSKEEAIQEKETIKKQILDGAVFIHGTDTIYGLGCNATDEEAVKRLRDTKRQSVRPVSIIVPNKEWIRENCEMNPSVESWLEKLPGPYTLILNLKNEDAIAESVNFGNGTIGVRLPDHWFTSILNEMNIPTITTSANITGENFMASREDLDPLVAAKCKFIVDEGVKKGKPSTLVDLTSDEISIQERE